LLSLLLLLSPFLFPFYRPGDDEDDDDDNDGIFCWCEKEGCSQQAEEVNRKE
jgi:hypothetical protein